MKNDNGIKGLIEKFSNKDLLKSIVSSSILGKISGKIINYRVENELKQSELASILEVSQAMVSKMESGEYNFTVKQLVNLCETLNWKIEVKIEDKETTKTINFKPNTIDIESYNFTNSNKNFRITVA